MRKYASAEEHAAKKNRKRQFAILALRRKYTDFRARFAHCYVEANAIVGMSFLRRAIAVEAR